MSGKVKSLYGVYRADKAAKYAHPKEPGRSVRHHRAHQFRQLRQSHCHRSACETVGAAKALQREKGIRLSTAGGPEHRERHCG